MQRRTTLQLGLSAGATLLAGCVNSGSSSDLSTSGDDDTPIDAEADALLLSSAAAGEVLGGDWSASEPHEESPITRSTDATRGYVPVVQDEESQLAGWITASAWTFESVEKAREAFGAHGYQSGWGFDEHEVAVECIGGTVGGNEAVVLFRDANAMGAVSRTDPYDSGESLVETTLTLSVAMHTTWRDG